jgi:hypothetical protein
MKKSPKPPVSATHNESIYRFAPMVSLSYALMNLYTFGFLFDQWNQYDPILLSFGMAHLLIPVYTLALSFDQVPLAQTIIYYFSSFVTTVANCLLFVDVGIGLLGLV